MGCKRDYTLWHYDGVVLTAFLKPPSSTLRTKGNAGSAFHKSGADVKSAFCLSNAICAAGVHWNCVFSFVNWDDGRKVLNKLMIEIGKFNKSLSDLSIHQYRSLKDGFGLLGVNQDFSG